MNRLDFCINYQNLVFCTFWNFLALLTCKDCFLKIWAVTFLTLWLMNFMQNIRKISMSFLTSSVAKECREATDEQSQIHETLSLAQVSKNTMKTWCIWYCYSSKSLINVYIKLSNTQLKNSRSWPQYFLTHPFLKILSSNFFTDPPVKMKKFFSPKVPFSNFQNFGCLYGHIIVNTNNF